MTSHEYTIGQLAKASETKPETIRYYEREGIMREPHRNSSGYRVFSDEDLKRLLFIRRSRGLGFSVDNVRELLELADDSDGSCADVDARVAEHLREVRERIARLNVLEAELQRLNDCCEGGKSITDCRIIETLSAQA